jgi:MYND finger
LKLLLILALVALLIWFAYRRLRPYLQLLRQLIGVLKGTIEAGSRTQSELRRDGENAESKLVRCAACNTWIPQSRAFNANAVSYCSRACLQKAPKVGRRKAAG